MQQTYQFSFPSFIREEFDKNLVSLNKKLAKIQDANEVEIVREHETMEKFLKPEAHKRHLANPKGELTDEDYLDVLFTHVEISLPIATKLPGFDYEGTINIEGGVKTIFSVNNKNLTELDPKHCDHCATNRKRNRVHVFSKDDQLLTIGSTCTHQYIGLDIDAALRVFFSIFGKEKIASLAYGSSVWGFDIETVAKATLYAYKLNPTYIKAGYKDDFGQYNHNSDSSRSNVSAALNVLWNCHPDYKHERERIEDLKDEAREMCKTIHAKFHDIDPNKGNFESNLFHTLFFKDGDKVRFRDFLVGKSLGLFVWAAFKAMNEAKAPKPVQSKTSVYIGKPSEHLNTEATVVFLKECFNDWGSTMLVKIETPEGNIVKTFTSAKAAYDLYVGDKVHVKGTISAHEEYNKIMETTIKRPKFKVLEQA